MDDGDTTSGSIASDGYDSYNVPEGIFRHQHNGRHWVHKMYHKFKTPLKSGTVTKKIFVFHVVAVWMVNQ